MPPTDNLSVKKSNAPAVKGEGLIYYYGSKMRDAALHGVDIVVEKGAIYGLLGPSGCGKTTLLRCIIGRLKPQDGVITVYGRRPGESDFCIPGRGVGYMPQEIALYSEITIKETLSYFGSLNLMDTKTLEDRISFLVKFLEIPNKSILVKNLSGGEKRRVSFAAALVHQPPLLILDEPTVGVDPLLRHSIWNHLKQLTTTSQMTIIITTHYVEEARQAHTVGLMREGHLLAEMNPEALIQRYEARSLEDVFWILCSRENQFRPKDNNISLSSIDNSSVGSSVTNKQIWYTREELQKANDSILEDTDDSNLTLQTNVALLHSEMMDGNLDVIYNSPSYFRRVKESNQRMGTLLKKSFVRLKRNIPFVLFQIMVPAIQVIVFCLCIGREPFDLPIAVVNLETHSLLNFSQKFLHKLDNHTFHKEIYPNLTTALESVENGETWGAVYVGPRFSSALIDRFLEGSVVDNETIEASEVKLHFDMTNQQIAVTMFTSILKSFQSFANDMLVQSNYNPRLSEAPVVIKSAVYGKLDPNFTEFMAPGMILGITYIMAVGLTAMSIIIEKKEGLLDRSWVAGVSAAEVMFSIIFSLFVMMIVQISLVLIFTFLVFNLPVLGSVFWVIICVILSGASGMAYGLFISSICDEENIAMMIAMGSFYPNLLLSGIIWPIEAMDYYLRYLSYCLPMTLLSNTMRSLMSRGWGISDHNIWMGCIISLLWTVGFILIAGVIFKFRK